MDNLDIYLLLNNKRPTTIYRITYFLILITLILIYIIFTYKYQSYYITKGKMINNKLEVKVASENVKYFKDNYYLFIGNRLYNYQITNVSNLYIDANFQNYIYLYLEIYELYNLDNYIYEIMIPKENKPIIKYLQNYL